MKPIYALLLSAALALQLCSCIRLNTDTNPAASEEPTTEMTESDTIDDSLVAPPATWLGASETAAEFFAVNADSVVDSSSRDYSYDDVAADLAQLQSLYPSRLSYRSYGRSVAGRELYVAVLGNPNAERQVVVSAGLHGREYLTPLLVMKQLEFYLYYYDVGEYQGISYADLFEDCCFYILPMCNPDGIMLSQEGIDSLPTEALRQTVRAIYEDDFRKGYTSQTDINEYLKFWKANAKGVDLNRNFDALWEDYRMGEPEPCHKNYKGPTPMSEPETQALAAFIDSLSNIAAVLCIHSQGEVLYWDCGQDEELSLVTRNFTTAIAQRTGYRRVDEKNNDASYSDWCALERGLIAVTVETGKGTCPLFIDKLEAMWFDNFDLLPLTAHYFIQ